MPALTVSVAPIIENACRYRFQFTVTKGIKDIESIHLGGSLIDGFSTPINVIPANNHARPFLFTSKTQTGTIKYVWLLA